MNSALSNIEKPKISCLMVTANRKKVMTRSIHCFLQQDYQNKELVVVDDGEQDLSSVLSEIPSSQLSYFKLEPAEQNTLGTLRNFAVQKATGRFLTQWDDDDWYHPHRIRMQVEMLQRGFDACCLSGTMMHLNTPEYMKHPYIGFLPNGFPGSIMHKKDDTIAYPAKSRGEDSVFLKKWMKKNIKSYPERIHTCICTRFMVQIHGNGSILSDVSVIHPAVFCNMYGMIK